MPWGIIALQWGTEQSQKILSFPQSIKMFHRHMSHIHSPLQNLVTLLIWLGDNIMSLTDYTLIQPCFSRVIYCIRNSVLLHTAALTTAPLCCFDHCSDHWSTLLLWPLIHTAALTTDPHCCSDHWSTLLLWPLIHNAAMTTDPHWCSDHWSTLLLWPLIHTAALTTAPLCCFDHWSLATAQPSDHAVFITWHNSTSLI